MDIDPTTTKYMIHATINAEGVIKKPDVVGAIFGQTEGLLGDELDLRDLQRSNRMGRIEVEVKSEKGKTEGTITMPSSLDKVETAILAAALETIERIGPCTSKISVNKMEDVRMSKRESIVERAKELLKNICSSSSSLGGDLTDSVRKAVQVEEIVSWGESSHPAGPNIANSDAIIIVEGRSDVLNLLKYGIKNTIGVGGTNIPDDIKVLTKERIVTAFVDGDRGGDLIIAELLQTAEVDFICKAPPNTEVEELTQKQIMKALRNKIPTEQYMEMFGLDDNANGNKKEGPKKKELTKEAPKRNLKKPRESFSKAKGRQAPGERRERRSPPNSRETRETREPRETRAPREPRAPRVRTPRAPSQKPDDVLSDKVKGAVKSVEELQQNQTGFLFDAGEKVLKEVKTGELVEVLGSLESTAVDTIVFGGLVTQKLVDTASEKGVKTIVGFKTHPNVKKIPDQLKVVTEK